MASLRTVSPDGLWGTMARERLKPTFYAECSDEDVARATERLVPQALEPFQRRAETTPARFGSVRRAYIECLRDRAIPIAMQRAMVAAQPCDAVFTIDTDHSPFYSRPREHADRLLSLA